MESLLIRDDSGAVIQPLLDHKVAHGKFTASASAVRNSTAFTYKIVRVTTTAAMNFLVGGSGVTADATGHYIPAGTYRDVYVGVNHYISVFDTGDVYFSEMG